MKRGTVGGLRALLKWGSGAQDVDMVALRRDGAEQLVGGLVLAHVGCASAHLAESMLTLRHNAGEVASVRDVVQAPLGGACAHPAEGTSVTGQLVEDHALRQ